MPTLGLRSDSVGNAPVTCRSAENQVEGQLTVPLNSHYVPVPDRGENQKPPFAARPTGLEAAVRNAEWRFAGWPAAMQRFRSLAMT
jgi:hypothetical protein